MARVLVTGMSGAGKTTLLEAVASRGYFYDTFDDVVLLSAPIEVLLRRVRTRTNNPYGRMPEHEAAIRRYTRTVEPLLRRGATLELDGRRPVEELADIVEKLLGR